MLLVPIEQAQPGMTLAAPVTHPHEPTRVLLRSGFRLRSSVMQSLRGLGVSKLGVNFAGLEEMDRHFRVSVSDTRQSIHSTVSDVYHVLNKQSADQLCFEACYRSSRLLVQTLRAQGPSTIFLDLLTSLPNDPAAHCSAVAHLAVLLGLQLEQYLISQRRNVPPEHAKEVLNLGVAAMIHELGKADLPGYLRRYNVATPPPAKRLAHWERHAALGHAMVQGRVESSAACAVLYHHQHFDKPENAGKDASGVFGRRIHIHARILAAADLYDRLSRPKMGVERTNLEVFYLIRSQFKGVLDPAVLQALVRVAPPFMPGTSLMLPDERQAMVVGSSDENPFVPVVRMVNRDRGGLSRESAPLSPTIIEKVRSGDGLAIAPYLPEQSWWQRLAA